MSKKNDSEKEKKLEIDFDAFEAQIDQEIDTLFVPADQQAPAIEAAMENVREAERPAGGAGTRAAPGRAPVEKPAGEAPLFPEMGKGGESEEIALTLESRTPPEIGADEFSLEEPLLQFSEPVAPSTADKAGAVSSDFLDVPLQMESRPAPPASANQRELTALLEKFNIAYLSLDWEFSVENLSKLDVAMGKLEPFCRPNHEAFSLYKMLRAVIQGLKTRTDVLSPPLVELIRDSQELLKLLLLSGIEPGSQEKLQLKNLLSRYQAIRDKAFQEKELRVEERAGGRPSFSESLTRPAVSMAPPPRRLEPFRWDSLADMKQWMESCSFQASEALMRFEAENRRLMQLEELLGKKPGFAPLTSRLTNIRSNLDRQLLFFREKHQEWDNGLEWLRGFEAKLEAQGHASIQQMAPLAFESLPATAAAPSPAPETGSKQPSEKRKTQVCLFSLSGNQYAVLASHVVKIEHISEKKADQIRSRGYATLTDFKPFFKTIKSNLFGMWSGLPAKVLKSYQFLPQLQDLLHVAMQPGALQGVMLLSNGQSHGLIFTESAGVNLYNEAEILVGSSEVEGVLGTIQTESGFSIEVLNIDKLLRKLQQERAEAAS